MTPTFSSGFAPRCSTRAPVDPWHGPVTCSGVIDAVPRRSAADSVTDTLLSPDRTVPVVAVSPAGRSCAATRRLARRSRRGATRTPSLARARRAARSGSPATRTARSRAREVRRSGGRRGAAPPVPRESVRRMKYVPVAGAVNVETRVLAHTSARHRRCGTRGRRPEARWATTGVPGGSTSTL